MLRYYLAATLLVAAFVFAVTARKYLPPDLRISAPATGTPSAPRVEASESPGTEPPVRGDAPWALSALPDCARQHSEDRGPAPAVRAKIPAGARAVDAPVLAGPCTIEVRDDAIWVARGGDRLRIPPVAHLFAWGGRYYLFRQDGSRGELRIYTLQQPGNAAGSP